MIDKVLCIHSMSKEGRGAVSPKGLSYCNNLIDELVSYGIKAHVTLNHFDLPKVLQDEYDRVLSPKIIQDFSAYADTCLKEFGDRVDAWITFNEPNIITVETYPSISLIIELTKFDLPPSQAQAILALNTPVKNFNQPHDLLKN
ncbi:hypothetical protein GIB67_016264, partial [Kingdonia uniflora]